MAKKKVVKKTQTRTPRRKSYGTRGLYATEHDLIIIAGGGLVVLMLTIALFLVG